jgi:hypothetical protein
MWLVAAGCAERISPSENCLIFMKEKIFVFITFIALVCAGTVPCRAAGTNKRAIVHNAVDLGLSVKWADRNVEASSPENPGPNFAWGSLIENDSTAALKSPMADITGSSRDVAYQRWGGHWRMPTWKEWKELKESCKWYPYKVAGIPMMKVVGPNGNSIILPFNHKKEKTDTYYSGNYWSGTGWPGDGMDNHIHAYSFTFLEDGNHSGANPFGNADLFAVRPVYDESEEKITDGDAIDLGLGVKWASHNLGANRPEQKGGLFGWGDISGLKTSKNVDDYPSKIPPINISGTAFDMARARLDGDWRLPTSEEIKNLINRCLCKWITYKGVKGMKVVGPNGNSIFLPAAGGRYGTDGYSLDNGLYWSGTLSTTDYKNADFLIFNGNYCSVNSFERSYGVSVRPVAGAYPINVVTGDARNVIRNGAILYLKASGGLNPHSSLDVGVIYGTSPLLNSINGTKVKLRDVVFDEFCYVPVYSLKPGTKYYYCAFIALDSIYYCGDVRTFSTPSDFAPAGKAVDLGLGVSWADRNMDAYTPGNYGGLYGWADTTGLKISIDRDDYPNANPPGNISGTDFDIAKVHWGNGWRLPTESEFAELIERCRWMVDSVDGTLGARAVGPNGNSIFLPFGGYRECDEAIISGGYGTFLTGTLSDSLSKVNFGAQIAYGFKGGLKTNDLLRQADVSWTRYSGLSVRPVRSRNVTISVITNDVKSVSPTTVIFSGTTYGSSAPHVEASVGIMMAAQPKLLDDWGKCPHIMLDTVAEGDFGCNWIDLVPKRTYYYRAFLNIDGKLYLGNVKNFTTPDYDPAGEAVDLGLSVKWASCNIGAVTPEQSGGYYNWAGPSDDKIGAQVNETANITRSPLDEATSRWGGSWRMPTEAEIRELCAKCNWEWSLVKGVNGMKVTGPSGRSIFLPAAGQRQGNDIIGNGESGSYWGGTSTDKFASGLSFFSNNYGTVKVSHHEYGFSVRAVTD